MVPAFQMPVPEMVIRPLPTNVGTNELLPNVKSTRSTLRFCVIVGEVESGLLSPMMTLSLEPGTRLCDQFAATFQSPLTILVQTSVKGKKCANRVRLVVIVTVIELLRVAT